MNTALAVADGNGDFLLSDDTVLPIYSLTKTYIAACVLASEIDLQATADRWLGPDQLPRGADLSVQQLLTHTSGLTDYGALPAYHQAIESGQP